jgi:hypothetical protein
MSSATGAAWLTDRLWTPIARQRLIEPLRLSPETHMREGYVMALRNAVDEYVRAILHDIDAVA